MICFCFFFPVTTDCMKSINVLITCFLLLLVQTMQKALSARQPNIDSINKKYGQMVKENHKQSISMTDTIQGRVVQLNNDWEHIQIMASSMKPAPDANMEVLKKGISLHFTLFYLFCNCLFKRVM